MPCWIAGESGFSPAVSRASVIRLVVPVFASFSTSDHEPSARCWLFKYRTPSRMARSTSSRVTLAEQRAPPASWAAIETTMITKQPEGPETRLMS